ncbi:phosphatidylinositol n-acetylglucosaminyltransferase subunit p [Anaeramoeba ignava]|uniref:Phosphatidylinositol n-acetylglucosaminyltransferase subunit p n=1 Tax=Anaeramoeba ignava TaxID=1746090 RepID=A0A9Q0R690_ANAIG|nr:phosphatidylinositol n-acetylglucosaminyltransferase subunit p [Anaeramoeba ignava]
MDKKPSIPQENKSSAVAYGFSYWMLLWVSLGCYFLWSFIPSRIYESVGITYYPNKYWAVAVPVYLYVFFALVFLMDLMFILLLTEPLDSFNTISDFASIYRTEKDPDSNKIEFNHIHEKDNEYLHKVPLIEDIPITAVNELLFRNRDGNLK